MYACVSCATTGRKVLGYGLLTEACAAIRGCILSKCQILMLVTNAFRLTCLLQCTFNKIDTKKGGTRCVCVWCLNTGTTRVGAGTVGAVSG